MSPDTEPQLVVRLLDGPLTIIVNGEECGVGGRRERTLLVWLVLQRKRALRDLEELMWPGQPPATARNSIQVAISRLRRSGLRIEQRGEWYILDPAISTDVDEWRDLVDQGDTEQALALSLPKVLTDLDEYPEIREFKARHEAEYIRLLGAGYVGEFLDATRCILCLEPITEFDEKGWRLRSGSITNYRCEHAATHHRCSVMGVRDTDTLRGLGQRVADCWAEVDRREATVPA